jgi:hypothetical protein
VRKAVASKRKPASRPKLTLKKSRKPVKTDGGVELKPIRDDITRAVESLKAMPSKEAIKVTIERLERCLAEFDSICDPQNPDSCGTTMTFWP